MKPIILVDCDDVLIDLVGEWITKLNDIYGTHYTAEDVPDWNMTGLFPDVNKEDLLKPLHKAEIWRKVSPIYDSVVYLKALISEGYEVYIVTATDYRNVKFKIESVISKYYPFIDTNHVIICYKKQLIGDENCVLIDDYENNLIGGKYKKVLFDRPHNRSVDTANTDIKRVYGWEQCYDYIHSLGEF